MKRLIHICPLINIRDYWGGHLSTFLYVMPILNKESGGVAISNCLRNPPMWRCIEDFLAEYQLITDVEMLDKLTDVTVAQRGSGFMPLAGYTSYRCTSSLRSRTPRDHRHKFPHLLPRAPFHRWLYGLFFKLALPFKCDIRQHSVVIYAPLNLSILFRLLHQLRILGYPSHWLHEALLHILQNTVRTTARPPRALPLRPADVARVHPERHLCTAPFAPEMRTLTRMFRPQVGFALLEHVLPPEGAIWRYRFCGLDYADLMGQLNCLVLVFWDDDLMEATGQAWRRDLRGLLDPSWGDEVDEDWRGKRFERFREKGVVMWSAAGWEREERVATAWMPEELVRMMEEKGWLCGLWRTDLWIPSFSQPNVVKDVVKRGERWVDVL